MLDFFPKLEPDSMLQILLRDFTGGAELYIIVTDPSGTRLHETSQLLHPSPPFSWAHIYAACPDLWSITPFTYLSLASCKRVLAD
jgi:hypothetical protein